MRISDWSSDVCSSDLGSSGAPPFLLPAQGCVRAQPRARPPQARQCRYSATLRHVWKEAQGSCPNHLRIALTLKLKRPFEPARLNDAARGQNMHKIRLQILEHPPIQVDEQKERKRVGKGKR